MTRGLAMVVLTCCKLDSQYIVTGNLGDTSRYNDLGTVFNVPLQSVVPFWIIDV